MSTIVRKSRSAKKTLIQSRKQLSVCSLSEKNALNTIIRCRALFKICQHNKDILGYQIIEMF